MSDDERKAARIEAFQQLADAEREHASAVAAIEKRIKAAERILAPIENARRELAAARNDLADVEAALYRAHDHARWVGRQNAPTVLVEALDRLKDQTRAALAFDASLDMVATRRMNARMISCTELRKEIEAALEGPLTAEQVDDLVLRAKTALFQ